MRLKNIEILRCKLLCLLLIISGVTLAQQWEWARTLNNSFWFPNHVFRCGDSGFYVTGRYIDHISIDSHSLSENGTHCFLGRFSTYGQCLWLETIPKFHEACGDGKNIYVAGDGEIKKYSSTGVLMNSATLSASCKMKLNSKNELIICAGYRDSLIYNGVTFSDSSAAILKVDSNLNLVASFQTSTFDTPVDIDISEDNSIFLVANKFFPCMYCGVTTILKFSNEIDLQINHFYSSGVGSHYYCEPDITCNSNGTIYVVQPYAYSSYDAALYSSELVKLNSWNLGWSGNLITCEDKVFACGVSRGVTCADTDSSVNVASIIMETDTSLNCTWHKTLELDNPLTGPGAYIVDFAVVDSEMYVVGMIDKPVMFDAQLVSPTPHSSYFADTYIAKLKYSQSTPLSTSSFIEASKFAIYPNPSSGKFIIENANKINSVSVTNIFGQRVYFSEPKSLKTEFDVGAVPQGVYFIELISNGSREVKKIVVE